MPFFPAVLQFAGTLVYLLLLYKALKSMHLGPRGSLVLLAVMVAAGVWPPFFLTPGLALDPGGFLVPVGLSFYLFFRAGKQQERFRGLLAAGASALSAFILDKILPVEPGRVAFDLDPLYVPALAAALAAYLTGRSRRASFVGAVLGVTLLDLSAWVQNLLQDVPGKILLGGGGVLGAAVLAGMLAVLLSEVVGETREFFRKRRSLR